MAKAKKRPHPLQPGGLAVAFLGLLVALWSFTGDRAFEFAYFFVALLGVAMVFGGVLTAAYGRAIAPRKAGKAGTRGRPVPKPEGTAEPSPAARAGLLARLRAGRGRGPSENAPDEEPSPESSSEKIPRPRFLARMRARLPTKGKAPNATGADQEPLQASSDNSDSRAPTAPRIRCPSCSHGFRLEDPTAVVMECPRCGLKGRAPALPADTVGDTPAAGARASAPAPDAQPVEEAADPDTTERAPEPGPGKHASEINPATVRPEPSGPRIRCPRCAHAFRAEAGSPTLSCPACGLTGRMPTR